MKLNKLYLVLPMAIMLVLMTLSSCEESTTDVSPEDSLAAIALVEQGVASFISTMEAAGPILDESDSLELILNAMDMNAAYSAFVQAQELNPYNNDANFGAGLTGSMMIMQNPALRILLVEWDGYFADNDPFNIGGNLLPRLAPNGIPSMIGLPLLVLPQILNPSEAYGLARSADVPLFSQLQSIIASFILPMVTEAISSMETVETDSNFNFIINYNLNDMMEGETEFDLTDVYAMEAMLYALQGGLQSALGYNLDFTSHDSLGIVTHLAPDSDFLTLNPGGAAILDDAQESFEDAAESMSMALTMVAAETDVQDNDFMTFETDEELAQAQADNAEMLAALNGPISFYDEELNSDSIRVDLSQALLNPIADLKAMLPPYEVATGRDSSYDWNSFELLVQHSESNVDVDEFDFNNTPVVFQLTYFRGDGNEHLQSQLTVNGLTFNIGPEDEAMLPAALWSAYQDFLLQVAQYELEVIFPHVDIFFYWSGTVTNGAALELTAYMEIEVEYLDGIYITPRFVWEANTYAEWLGAWPDATFNGIFPDATNTDLEWMFGFDPDEWSKDGY